MSDAIEGAMIRLERLGEKLFQAFLAFGAVVCGGAHLRLEAFFLLLLKSVFGILQRRPDSRLAVRSGAQKAAAFFVKSKRRNRRAVPKRIGHGKKRGRRAVLAFEVAHSRFVARRFAIAEYRSLHFFGKRPLHRRK